MAPRQQRSSAIGLAALAAGLPARIPIHGRPLTDLPWMSAAITAAVLLLTLWSTRYYGCRAGMARPSQPSALAPSRSDA